jgi:hypothetical protein
MPRSITSYAVGRSRQAWDRPVVADQTGPLSFLTDRSVLVIADMENLVLGARDLGLVLDLQALAVVLRDASNRCELHAFYSRVLGDNSFENTLTAARWTSHPRTIEVVQSFRGPRRRANSDNTILIYTGALAIQSVADVVILATGDGDLAVDGARHLGELRPEVAVATMSLAGSTSPRLNAQSNPDITANIEIGRDCLLGSGR